MYILADCNNFFVSCERLFAPNLNGKPVIVLSGNDGCVIARSNEAKAIGIPMCAPLFKVQYLIKQHNVHICSSNIILYGDISSRVMSILKRFAPSIEVYSIDEAFMDFSGTETLFDIEEYAEEIAKCVYKATGIPISLGIAPTKTLAKIASKLAKSNPTGHTYKLSDKEHIDKVLSSYPIGDIWGIGRQSVEKFHKYGIYTAKEFVGLSSAFLRSRFSILAERTAYELRGVKCFEFEDMPTKRESITSSKSFSVEITDVDTIREALAYFVSGVHQRLLKQNSVCGAMTVYLQTNRFNLERYYFNSLAHHFEQHTDSLIEMTSMGTHLLDKIFVNGYGYKKCGVILSDIAPKSGRTISLFEQEDYEKKEKLSKAINSVNDLFGKNCVVSARKGFGKIPIRRDNLSPQYTTAWSDILVVKCEE